MKTSLDLQRSHSFTLEPNPRTPSALTSQPHHHPEMHEATSQADNTKSPPTHHVIPWSTSSATPTTVPALAQRLLQNATRDTILPHHQNEARTHLFLSQKMMPVIDHLVPLESKTQDGSLPTPSAKPEPAVPTALPPRKETTHPSTNATTPATTSAMATPTPWKPILPHPATTTNQVKILLSQKSAIIAKAVTSQICLPNGMFLLSH